MSDPYQDLLRRVGNLQRLVGQMVRVGTVHEVRADMVRMVMGMDKDRKPVLSPWLPTGGSMYGGARERRFYKKGQNVVMLMPNGDPAQGIVIPYAPNKNFTAPDHANNSGQDEETYQLDDLRVRKTKNGYEIWLEAPSGGGSDATDKKDGLKDIYDQKAKSGGGEARMKVRINNDGGITGRVGKMRFAAHKDGAKIKAEKDGKKQYLVVLPDKIIASKELIIDDDPIPDDDA